MKVLPNAPHARPLVASLAALGVLGGAVAHADPTPPAPAGGPVAPVVPPPPAPTPEAAPSPPEAAPPPVSAPAVGVAAPVGAPSTAAYDAAFDALVRGDLARAGAGFREAAAGATDPAQAARAAELQRLAERLLAARMRIVPVGSIGTDDRDDGRTSLVAWTTGLGLAAGGVLADDLALSSPSGIALLLTATTAGALVGSYAATSDAGISGAEADAYAVGILEGGVNAALLAEPLGLDTSSERALTATWLAAAAGGGAGLAMARAYHPTRGQVAFAGTLSVLGAASVGFGVGLVAPDAPSGERLQVLVAGGFDAGLAAGAVLGRGLDWSPGRGRLVQLGTLVGGLAGIAGAVLMIDGGDLTGDTAVRLASATVLAGMWGGFAFAVHRTDGMRPDPRFAGGGTTTQLAPMAVRGGGGLALAGSF